MGRFDTIEPIPQGRFSNIESIPTLEFISDPFVGAAIPAEETVGRQIDPGQLTEGRSVAELMKTFEDLGLSKIATQQAQERFGGEAKALLDNLGIDIIQFLPLLLADIADDPLNAPEKFINFPSDIANLASTAILGQKLTRTGQPDEPFKITDIRFDQSIFPFGTKEISRDEQLSAREELFQNPLAPILAILPFRPLVKSITRKLRREVTVPAEVVEGVSRETITEVQEPSAQPTAPVEIRPIRPTPKPAVKAKPIVKVAKVTQPKKLVSMPARRAEFRIDVEAESVGVKSTKELPASSFKDLGDFAVVGAEEIVSGAKGFTQFSEVMTKRFGESIKPHLEKIHRDAREIAGGKEASFVRLRNFHESISTKPFGPGSLRDAILLQTRKEFAQVARDVKLTPKQKRIRRQEIKNEVTKLEAQKRGIAIRTTPAGNTVPSVRNTGVFVPEDFATYENFKDIRGRLSKTPTIALQEIDGSLSAQVKSELPKQAGPAERYVTFRTRDIKKMQLEFNKDQSSQISGILKELKNNQLAEVTKTLGRIDTQMAKTKPETLAKRLKFTGDIEVLKAAQETRLYFDRILELQNEMRRLREQKQIPRRSFYTPDILRRISIFEKAFGHDKTTFDIMERPELPDFIQPNKPFNPRELAKRGNIEFNQKELNISKLMDSYANTASRDIFNTEIIQNNKAFAQQLRAMGKESSAKFIEDFTAESFAGVKGSIDRAFQLNTKASKALTRFRTALNRSVFPLNVAWSLTVQTSSAALTVARYGVKNSAKGMFDWFGNSTLRVDILNNAYSAVVKNSKDARTSKQDVGSVGSGRIVSRPSRFDNMVDASNGLTDWIERELTGWSIATAKLKGQELGLKGRSLWEYASDGGAKTQSMYNLEDAPAILRNQLIKTGAPFQTFRFELYNTAKEFAGKTGTPPGTTKQRIGQLTRFTGSIMAINYIWSQTTGKEPWDLRAFIPFYNSTIGPIFGEDVGRALPAPVGIVKEGVEAVQAVFKEGIKDVMQKGDWTKLRRWTLKYLTGFAGIPAGGQINRTVDGIIATSKGGDFTPTGRMRYPITEIEDQIIAITAGKYATKGGREYLDNRFNRRNLVNRLLKPNAEILLLPFEAGSNVQPFRVPLKGAKPKRRKKSKGKPVIK